MAERLQYFYSEPTSAYEEGGSHHVDPPEWHEEPPDLGDWEDPDQDYPVMADESEYMEEDEDG